MPVKCQTVVTFLEELAPKSLALEGDNAGWQVGDPQAEVSRVLLALDIDERVIDEAVDKGAGLIITHHPFIFKGLRSIRLDLPTGKIIGKLVRHNINLYAAHTNLDAAEGGVNSVLAGKLNLVNVKHLTPDGEGLGRIGLLEEPVTFYEFVAMVKTVLEVPAVRAGGPEDRKIRKVALCGGSGSDLWPKAKFAGADVFVTGDIKYHVAQDILAAGLNFVDPGHYASERVILEPLREFLVERCRKAGAGVEIIVSETYQEPFTYL
ncbi:MAG: Nif3-like dinuclear metal center hexameric protein [Peptococcaceae bacterium]|nr:Nif3-like dinuclear metal center hexameric protein [Peptococcaceae bacterium]